MRDRINSICKSMKSEQQFIEVRTSTNLEYSGPRQNLLKLIFNNLLGVVPVVVQERKNPTHVYIILNVAGILVNIILY